MCFCVIFPILTGLITFALKEDNKLLHTYALCVLIINVAATWIGIFAVGKTTIDVIHFTDYFTIAFAIDGMSKVFAGMISVLWVFTAIYAFGYMSHEGMERKFFAFFIMTEGVVTGIAFAKNLPTLYLFYEYLTFATLPLVMHQMTRRSRFAGKVYLVYSICGGALVFGGMIYLIANGIPLDFRYGGAISDANETYMRIAFLVLFFGFGVKAAIFPLCKWLPTASVAPTPVTALLHAVAVVKSGVFAIARVTYFIFGTEILQNSFAQDVMMLFAAFTILYGSLSALRIPHLKRRLAYSTISNLSYIIFGLSIMTRTALTGAMLHMLFHAVIKITLFFCAGAILVRTGDEYVYQLKGYGRRMPITLACFTVCGLGLIGIPPFGAFTSKYLMATAGISSGNIIAYIGIGALIASEILTALYIFKPVIEAYFPEKGYALADNAVTGDCAPNMTVTILILTVLSVCAALSSDLLINMLDAVL